MIVPARSITTPPSFLAIGAGSRIATGLLGGAIAVLLAAVVPAHAQLLGWEARFNGQDNQDENISRSSLVVDSSGNIYTAGYSNTPSQSWDAFVVKYNSLGGEEWSATYDFAVSADDYAYDLVVDSSGNVYICGTSNSGAGHMDLLLIKYDSSGNELWVQRYDNGNHDTGNNLDLDASGNVYVAGQSVTATNSDVLLIKYDSDGTQQWLQTYDGPISSNDYGTWLDVDDAGNPCVTGYSEDSGTSNDIVTIKYDAVGSQVWAARYDNGYNSTDVGHMIAADAAGDVYVCGYGYAGSGNDMLTLKYDGATGNQVWLANYNGPANTEDVGHALALDPNGYVVSIGYSSNGNNNDFATVKYDAADGSQVWASRYSYGEDVGYDVAVDASGDVYVVGYSSEPAFGSNDYATVKYRAANGAEIWSARYDGGGFQEDVGQALELTPEDDVAVCGYSYSPTTGYDATTLLYLQCSNATADCNTNGIYDLCDISSGFSEDCNLNTIPDECDTDAGTSFDCDSNTVPDECDNVYGTVEWTGSASQSYHDAANWNPMVMPKGEAQASLVNNGPTDKLAVISRPGRTGVCTAEIAATGLGRQTLQVNAESNFHAGGSLGIYTGGTLDLHGGSVTGTSMDIDGLVTGGGSVQVDTFYSNGQILVPGLQHFTLDAPAAFWSLDAQITAQFFSTLHVISYNFGHSGFLDLFLGASALYDVPFDFQNEAGSVVSIYGGSLASTSHLTNVDGGQIDIFGGSLATVTGFVNERFANLYGYGAFQTDYTNDGQSVFIADTQIVGDLDNEGTITLQGGLLTVTGNLSGSGAIIGGFGSRDGDPTGIVVEGDFNLATTDYHRLDLTGLTLHMAGPTLGGPQTLEVLGPDLGPVAALPRAQLFSMNTLRIGPAGTSVKLVNRHANTPVAPREAMYVQRLELDTGVTLDLAGQTLYYGERSITGHTKTAGDIRVIDTVGGGRLVPLQAPGAAKKTGAPR